MTIIRKALHPVTYVLIIGICLLTEIVTLYVNFSDFIAPFPVVVALLIVCALVALLSFIGYYRAPRSNNTLYARLGRMVLLSTLAFVIIILILLPVLVIENA